MLCNRPIIGPEFVLRNQAVDKWSGGRELQNGCLVSCRSLVCGGVDVPWGDMQWFALATAPASSYLIGWDDWWKKTFSYLIFQTVSPINPAHQSCRLHHPAPDQSLLLLTGWWRFWCEVLNSCLSQSGCAKLFEIFLKIFFDQNMRFDELETLY